MVLVSGLGALKVVAHEQDPAVAGRDVGCCS